MKISRLSIQSIVYFIVAFVFTALPNHIASAQYTDPLSVDSDGLLPIDFEPMSLSSPVSSMLFDIDGDGNLETLTFSAPTALGVPTIHYQGPTPGAFPTPTKALSSQPNFKASEPITISFSKPLTSFSFDLMDPNYPTAEDMASLVGLDISTSSLNEIIEALDAIDDPRGVVIRAFDGSGNPVAVYFCIEDYDPTLPIGTDPRLSQLTNLSTQGGPVEAVSIPGDGNFFGFSSELVLNVLSVSIGAFDTPFSQITITAPAKGSLGVPRSGDFITLDNFDKISCSGNSSCTSFPCGKKDKKVQMCHVPPGNPDEAHEICVSPTAVPAHLAHGDYCGPCNTNLQKSVAAFDKATESETFNKNLIYPNPSSGNVFLEMNQFLGQRTSIKVFNNLGQQVYHYAEREITEPNLELRLSEHQLPDGIYVISIESNKFKEARSIIISRLK